MKLVFCLWLWLAAGVPVDLSSAVYDAADEQSIDRYDLAAVLISEHSGPDVDFSLVGAMGRGHPYDWTDHREGAQGEQGAFQLMPRHAHKIGASPSEIDDPAVNVRTAAAVVRANLESHLDCKGSHDWIAHYKCARAARDDRSGGCRFAQLKFHLLRHSLGRLGSPDFRALANEYKTKMKEGDS